MTSFLEATANRRSIYTLRPSLAISEQDLISMVERCVLTVPSSFNTQSTRIAVFLDEEHKKVWNLAADALLGQIGTTDFQGSGHTSPRKKLGEIQNAFGSIFFFYDQELVTELKNKGGHLHGPKAEEWTLHSDGMHQYYMWTAVEMHGLGASLQHWNPWIDDAVKKAYHIPEHWVLKAQLIFGDRSPDTRVDEKAQRLSMSERVKVFGRSGSRNSNGI